MNQIEKLEILLRARTPLICITSHEEDRVVNSIRDVIESMKRGERGGAVEYRLARWSVTRGVVFEDGGKDIDPQETVDPDSALSAVLEYANRGGNQPTLFVFHDLHAFMQDNPRILRFLRDVAREFPVSYHTLVLLSPYLKPPPDLEKEISLLDWALPDRQELEQLLARTIEILEKRGRVKISAEGKEAIVRSLQGLTAFEAKNALNAATIQIGKLCDQVIPLIIATKKKIIRSSEALEFIEPQGGLEQVGGLDLLKKYARVKLATFSEKAQENHVLPAKGVLVAGVPGTGKSLTAKAVSFGKFPLIRVDMGAIYGGLVGESERNVRVMIKTAEAIAPCVLWFDEIEKGLGGAGGEMDGGTSQRVFATILTWMQEKTAPVYIIATANRAWSLPSEFLRRFDDIFFVDLPHFEDRIEIAKIHLHNVHENPAHFDLGQIAQASYGYTGAEIQKGIVTAKEYAFFNECPMDTELVIRCLKEVVPIAKTSKSDIENLRNWGKTHAKPASSLTLSDEAPYQVGDPELFL